MLLKVECKKCGESFKLDIGTHTKEETIEMLKNRDTFECPGHHVELSSPVNYWIFGDVVPGNAPSEKEFLKKLKAEYPEVYKNKDLEKKYTVSGFSMGCCICRDKTTGKKAYFDFENSPAGTRFYYKIGDE